jgi:Protein of unknown function (DUF3455)
MCFFIAGLVLWTSGLFAQQVALPAILNVPAGNRLFLHVYAKGVQIYRYMQDKNDTTKYVWAFIAPDAELFTAADYKISTGKHYAGPVWESSDGSKVTGKKLQQANAPDAVSIPWLLLSAANVSGSGVFSSTTFIQRVNTQGGNAPPIPADKVKPGTEVDVQYTAEYLFYRPAN